MLAHRAGHQALHNVGSCRQKEQPKKGSDAALKKSLREQLKAADIIVARNVLASLTLKVNALPCGPGSRAARRPEEGGRGAQARHHSRLLVLRIRQRKKARPSSPVPAVIYVERRTVDATATSKMEERRGSFQTSAESLLSLVYSTTESCLRALMAVQKKQPRRCVGRPPKSLEHVTNEISCAVKLAQQPSNPAGNNTNEEQKRHARQTHILRHRYMHSIPAC